MKSKIRDLKIPLLIFLSYIIINYFFNFNLWDLSLKKVPNTIVTFGEWTVYEHTAEIVYQNILDGKNPFSRAPLLYPFGWYYALEDVEPLNGLYFLFLRPFLSSFDAFTFIVMAGLILNCISMYILLRLLKMSRPTAYLMSLVYAYSPFVAVRLGHPTYTDVYLFPFFAASFLQLLRSKQRSMQIVYAILLGTISALTVLSNLYFAVMIFLMGAFFATVFLYWKPSEVLRFFKEKIVYIIIAILTSIVLLLPWLIKVYQGILFDDVSSPIITDTAAFSAGLFDILIPGHMQPILGEFIKYLYWRLTLMGVFENFVYPGLIILSAFGYFILFRKRISRDIQSIIAPLAIVSLLFWILTLGPSLKIFGFNTSLPLPYALLNDIPFIQLARAPGRFVIVFIFLGSVIAAYIIEHLRKTVFKDKILQRFLYITLSMLFLLDQSYTAAFKDVIKEVPSKAYRYIRQQEGNSPVLEIPFVVRDGLRNFGDYTSAWRPRTQLLHGKPTFSLYAGRINEDIFIYYNEDPFIGTIGRMIDPLQSKQSDQIVSEKRIGEMARSINFLGIEHILLKRNEPYTKRMQSIIQKLGYEPILRDGDYTLYFKESPDNEYREIDLSKISDRMLLAHGWGPQEETGRWIVGKVASIFFKINTTKLQLVTFNSITLAENQEATLYVNRQKIGTIKFKKGKDTYAIRIGSGLRRGTNTLTFIFSKTVQPSQLFAQNSDSRNLSAFIKNIRVTDVPAPQ